MALLELENLQKDFLTPDGNRRPVLMIPRLQIETGEAVALVGESGSGKTTLLHLVAGILRADAGRIRLCGTPLETLSESDRDAFRARHVGYIFQSFHLLPGYSALENVLLGMTFGPGPDRDRARELLDRLGLADRLHDRPRTLSLGQQQRVAVARALANRPDLVLADEPTGNLDPERAVIAIDLLLELCREQGAGLLLVSHDPTILSRFDRVEQLSALNRVVEMEEGGA